MALYELEYRREGSGFFEKGQAGETLGARKLVYLDTNGSWMLADADAAARFPVVGITMEAIASGKLGRIFTFGYIGDSSWAWSDLGASVYASDTPGELTQTQPTGEVKIQAIGLAKESDLIFFNTGLNREIADFSISETNWEDLRFPVAQAVLMGANPATFTSYKDAAILSFATSPAQYAYFVAQLSHTWAEGTAINPHIHWTIPTSGAGTGAENVKWDITYSFADIGGTFPNSTSDTITRDVQNITADTHMLNNFADIVTTGKDKSAILLISIKRDTGVANDYTDDAYLAEFDLHFRINRAGSTGIPSDVPA